MIYCVNWIDKKLTENKQWVGLSVSPTNKTEGRIHMLLAMLQALFNFMLKLSVIFGFIFMIACTVFVIVCIVHGDIKVNIVRVNAEKENE